MIDPPQVRPEEPTAVTPHGGICGGESQQWLSYPTKPHVYPSTIWQNIIVVLAGSVRSRADWRHAENDVDLLVIDFDPLDEETDQVAPEMPISFRQTVSYLLSEIAQLPDDQGQGAVCGRLVGQVVLLVFQDLEALSRLRSAARTRPCR